MAEFGYPVVYDAGHSVQLPGGQGAASGGQRQFIRPLARAAVAVGVDAVFLEVHEDPDQRLSDGPNSYRLDELPALLARAEAHRCHCQGKARRPPRRVRPGAATESEAVAPARRVLAIEAGGARGGGEPPRRALRSRRRDLLAACRGKVVVTGMGKSGIICRKIAATLASTGTPAIFLHAAEAAHGDFGVVGKDDVVLALSNSGEIEEMVRLLPLIKRYDLPLIAITGDADSTLARAADVVLDASVPEEACPLGLAPTASTTAALALGDALAVALFERNGFSEDDFAVLHPGGQPRPPACSRWRPHARRRRAAAGAAGDAAGRDRAGDHAASGSASPAWSTTRGELVGVITDGDLRRGLERADGRPPPASPPIS